MAGDNAMCNDLLRLWTSSSNFNQIFEGFAGAGQVDHFFEVQHVVNILFGSHGPLTSDTFFRVPVGYFVDIATFISGRDNLFMISAADNQTKKNIPWDSYRPDVQPIFLRNYLKKHVGTDDRLTVSQTVCKFAVAMAKREGPYAYLTRAVGQAICQQMEFKEGILTLPEHRVLGDFVKQVWQ
jgi:hypothetical protein